jgi:hypothetical protein
MAQGKLFRPIPPPAGDGADYLAPFAHAEVGERAGPNPRDARIAAQSGLAFVPIWAAANGDRAAEQTADPVLPVTRWFPPAASGHQRLQTTYRSRRDRAAARCGDRREILCRLCAMQWCMLRLRNRVSVRLKIRHEDRFTWASMLGV